MINITVENIVLLT